MIRTNKDHAKKKQRPMLEDEVIANQLDALLTPSLIAQEHYYIAKIFNLSCGTI